MCKKYTKFSIIHKQKLTVERLDLFWANRPKLVIRRRMWREAGEACGLL